MGQALAAESGIGGERRPARLDQLPIGLLEAGWGGDGAVGMAHAAVRVADLVQRLQHLLEKFCALSQHLIDEVERSLREARQVGVAIDAEHIFEEKAILAQRRCVGRHGGFLWA
jgi:hypothetical protein